MSNTIAPLNPTVPLSDGHWVNERVAHIVEEIRAYHPHLDVMWNPNAGPDEPEFLVVENIPDGRQEIVIAVNSQAEFTGEILARIIAGDTSRRDVLSEMDAKNEAVMRLQRKMAEESFAEVKDIAKHVLQSPLNSYRVNKDLVIKDHGNRL